MCALGKRNERTRKEALGTMQRAQEFFEPKLTSILAWLAKPRRPRSGSFPFRCPQHVERPDKGAAVVSPAGRASLGAMPLCST